MVELISPIFFLLVALVYGLTLLTLSSYGLNFFYLVWIAWRHRNNHTSVAPQIDYPMITVQLPIYNERYVAERVIDAICKLDWPSDRLEVQVLDDSTDMTVEIAARAVWHWQAEGVNIVHLHRTLREGYKAGALSTGLQVARGEFIAIFDADFVPEPDFLKRTIPHLLADAQLAFVQARWGHLNRTASLLTMLQSVSIDGHFMVEQFARDRGGYVMNFNGTAGVWRRRAIEDAGGWSAGTLTEDLDLSYRAALRGWQARLLPEVVAPAELVNQIGAYRRQQTRWARGSIECALRLLPQVGRSSLPRGVKVQSFFHLTGYLIQVLMLIVSLIYPLVVTAVDHSPALYTVYALGWFFAPIAFAPTLFFSYGQVALERRAWWRRIPYVLLITALGSGMVLNGTRAIGLALRKRASAFERTPKVGQVGRNPIVKAREYATAFDPIVFGEIVLCLFNLNTARLALQAQSWGIALYALVFAAGLAYVAGASLWEGRESLRAMLVHLGSSAKSTHAKSSKDYADVADKAALPTWTGTGRR